MSRFGGRLPPNIGESLFQISRQLPSSHARHYEVCHDEVDLRLIPLADFKCRFPVCRFQGLIADLLQAVANIAANRGIVLDDENGLALGAPEYIIALHGLAGSN